jgi:uncharacterized protein (DUF885 family)
MFGSHFDEIAVGVQPRLRVSARRICPDAAARQVRAVPGDSYCFAIAESVAARLAAQDTLFKQQYEDDMRASPERETARGDYRDNAMLDDYSLAASVKQNAVDRAYRAKLAAISTEGFPEQDRMSHDLLLHVLDNRIANYELKTTRYPYRKCRASTTAWPIF